MHWRFKKNILLQNHGANFNQTWPKSSLSQGYIKLLKWRARPFSKRRWLRNSKNLKTFSRSTGPISTKLSKNHPWLKSIEFVQMERPHLFTLGDNSIFLLNYWASFIIYMYIIITSLKCIHWFELVSQVSDVAYGPLVNYVL